MPDFTARGAFGKTTVAISNFGDTTIGDYYRGTTSTPSAGNAYDTANTATYSPFIVTWPFLAQKMAVQVVTQSGSMDVGIYSEKGTRLVSMGSTAVAAAGLQTFDITDTWLNPGTYFMAINCDNTTASFQSMGGLIAAQIGRVNGIQQQAVGAVALPSTATFATFTLRALPIILVAGNATI